MILHALRVSCARNACRISFENFSTAIRAKNDNNNVKLSDQTRNKSLGRRVKKKRLEEQAINETSANTVMKLNDNQVTVIGDSLSENSRKLKKPKKRPVKLLNKADEISKGLISSAATTEGSKMKPLGASRKFEAISQDSMDILAKLTNKHTAVEQESPFMMPNVRKSPFVEVSSRPKGKLTFSKKREEVDDEEKDRPFTLPSGKFKPRQSLGQNFLSDQNYVMKICDSFKDNSDKGKNVIEIGPGPGALTRVLHRRYPNMTAIEIDERAVDFLTEKIPGIIFILPIIV